MKRFISLLLAFTIVFTLSSCKSDNPDNPDNTSDIQSTTEENKFPNALAFPEKVEYETPSITPSEYNPEIEYIPMINQRSVYAFGVYGDMCFVNKDGKKLMLDEEIFGYDVGYSDEGVAQCIALSNKDGKAAIMRLDGSMATDFIYELIPGENSSYVLAGYGCAVLVKANGDKPGEEIYAVIDIKSGKELFQTNKNNFNFEKNMLIARSEDSKIGFTFYDYSGKVLFDTAPAILDSNYSGSSNSTHYFDNETLVLYETNDADGNSFIKRGEYYLQYKYPPSDERMPGDKAVLTIYNLAGEILYHYESCNFKILSSDTFYVDSYGEITIFKYGENARILSAEESLEDYIENNINTNNTTFEKNILYLDSEVGSGLSSRYFIINDKGERIYLDGYECEKLGAFIKAVFVKGSGNNAKKYCNIYNLQGELIAKNLISAISELYFDDRIFIYKDVNTGGFLFADGRFEKYDAIPKVNTFFYNG